MENEKNLIMVTWDFTEKNVYAIEHAIKMNSFLKGEIAAVHIVKKEDEIPQAKKRMADEIRKKFPDPGINFSFVVRSGSIFHTIGELATELNALMVVMGTHGITGMQKFLGSWALKVIASSKAPFVVVQQSPKPEAMKNIVLPINYKRETKEIVAWTHFFSRKFGTKFHLFRAKYQDSNFRKGLDSNMFFITKYFSSKGIRFETELTVGENDFGKETIKYAKSIDSDAIMLMTTRDIGFTDYVLGAQEQYIIANSERIPVICINPRPAKIGGGFSASGG
ncbi:MAG TPA: universal stress protein [Bacteroidales bacterium]|jgi:nucleotide-binding universal stress UspA family protein|nr:universal stress protein [Bacteroidales bacterium]